MMREIEEVLSGARRWCVVQADCRDVLRVLPDGAVDHVITDPPFSREVHAKQRRIMRGAGKGLTGSTRRAANGVARGVVESAELGFDALSLALQAECAREFVRVVRKGWIIVKADGDVTGPRWYRLLIAAKAKKWGPVYWVKENAQPNLTGRGPACMVEMLVTCTVGGPGWNAGGGAIGKGSVYFAPVATGRNQTGARWHTTQTPEELWAQVLRDYVRPGQLIIDPFCGSASLGAACIRRGLRYIGIDSDAGDPARAACPEPYAVRARRHMEEVEREVAEVGEDPRRWMAAKQEVLL